MASNRFVKSVQVFKSDFVSDAFDRRRRLLQKMPGLPHPPLRHVPLDRLRHGRLEEPGEMIMGKTHFPGQGFDQQRFVQAQFNLPDGLGYRGVNFFPMVRILSLSCGPEQVP